MSASNDELVEEAQEFMATATEMQRETIQRCLDMNDMQGLRFIMRHMKPEKLVDELKHDQEAHKEYWSEHYED